MAEPVAALEYISTAVSVAQFLLSKRLAVTAKSIRAFFRLRDETPPAYLVTPEGAALVKLIVIHPDLLNDLTRDTKDRIERYRDCLRKATKR